MNADLVHFHDSSDPKPTLTSAGRWLAAVGMSLGLMGTAWVYGLPGTGPFFSAAVWCSICGYLFYRMLAGRGIYRSRYFLFLMLAMITLAALGSRTFLAVAAQPGPQSFRGPVFDNPCHIAMAGNLPSMIRNIVLALSGGWAAWGHYYLGGIGFLALTLFLGTGWCSWACGYGAWDETCSRLPLKLLRSKININMKNPIWKHLSVGFFLSILMIAWWEREPVFCQWFCPFKIGEDLWASAWLQRLMQILMTSAVIVFFVVLLPWMTGKRTFCRHLCPFGVWQRWAGRLAPFRMAADPAECSQCGQCAAACPMQAIEWEGTGSPRITRACTLCGRCLDFCSAGALYIGWSSKRARQISGLGRMARPLFLFTALWFAGLMGLPAAVTIGLGLFGIR